MKQQALLLHTRQQGEIGIIDVMGAVNAETGEQLHVELIRLCNLALKSIIVNLENTNQLDSAGLRTLIVGSRQARRRGVNVSLLAPHGAVRQILYAAQVTETLPIFDSESQALEQASKSHEHP